ncbi:MAG: bifunctional nicotinamidase/pyrazinamidase [Planctomycetota bacterium]
MNVLILVDVQIDFTPPNGSLAVPEGNEVVAVANRIASSFDRVIATQDCHPADHGSFAANHEGREVGEVIHLHGLDQILWPTHCVQGSTGAEFHPELDRALIHEVFPKGTDPDVDSYSGFFDNGKRRATGLGDRLKELEVRKVFVMGLATDYCVKFTALDAVGLGFDVTLIEDGCRGVDLSPGDVAAAIAEMKDAGVRVISSTDI